MTREFADLDSHAQLRVLLVIEAFEAFTDAKIQQDHASRNCGPGYMQARINVTKTREELRDRLAGVLP